MGMFFLAPLHREAIGGALMVLIDLFKKVVVTFLQYCGGQPLLDIALFSLFRFSFLLYFSSSKHSTHKAFYIQTRSQCT